MRKLTSIELEILAQLWDQDNWKMPDSYNHKQACKQLINHWGYVAVTNALDAEGNFFEIYTLTNKGCFFVDYLLGVPIPQHGFYIPKITDE